MTPRKMLLTLHLAIGLVAAPVLVLLGLTGAVLAFEDPLDRLLNARLLEAPGSGPLLSLAALEARLRPRNRGARVVGVSIPSSDRENWILQVSSSGGGPRDLVVNPHDGTVVGDGAGLRRSLGTIHQLHTRLLAGAVGRTVVGWGGVALALLAVSGLILWWPGKILRVRRGGGQRRVVFELHAALGGATWVALLLLGLTGMAIHWNRPLLSLAAALLHETVPPDFPDVAFGCAGQPSLSIARIVDLARRAVPGARVTRAFLDRDAPARVVLKFPEDRTPAGRTNVFIAPCDGRVIDARSSRLAPASYRALSMWNRSLHTGDLWGWPTRILAALVSLTLPVMSFTGPMIWWNRRRAASRRRG